MSADVELQNISVTFGNFYAAKNVNVKINEGEFFSFLGPSGCGKTTILRAISGFLDPSEGKVLIFWNLSIYFSKTYKSKSFLNLVKF